jgi:hypothetical protein
MLPLIKVLLSFTLLYVLMVFTYFGVKKYLPQVPVKALFLYAGVAILAALATMCIVVFL